jgi:hypothetical protein
MKMKHDPGRLAVLLVLILILAMIPIGMCTSVNIPGGTSSAIKGADSVQGVSTSSRTSIAATGSIQAAVNAATAGATISLLQKTYYENVKVSKSLNIVGAGIDKTIVDGGQKGSVFYIQSPGPTVTLASMTIKNGKAQDGAGVLNLGTLTINNAYITENKANAWGGGVANFGIDINGVYKRATLTMTGSTVASNNAGRWGGGIASDGIATISGSTISQNTAGQYAGGVYNDGQIQVTNTIINGNSAMYGGGLVNDCDASISGGSITNNKATASDGNGGGIGNWGDGNSQAELTVSGTTISGNNAIAWGGGVSNDGIATVTSSTISGNNAPNGAGVYNDGSMKMTGNSISGNTASRLGGGVYNDGTATINDGSISGNKANLGGGGIFNANTLSIGGTSQITNNQATAGYGGGIYSYSGPVTLSGTNVNIKSNWGHTPSSSGSSWYNGWGVYFYNGIPTIIGGFNPANQVTGNTHS